MAMTAVSVSAHSFLTEDDALALVLRGSTLTGDDQIIFRQKINAAVSMMESWTGRFLKSRAYTDLQVGTSRPGELRLPEWPITALTSVRSLDSQLGETTIDLTYALIDRAVGIVRLRDGGSFARGEATMLVNATLGYTSADHPSEWYQLCEAQQALVALLWQRHSNPHLVTQTSTAIGPGAGMNFRADKMPDEVRGLLERFLRSWRP